MGAGRGAPPGQGQREAVSPPQGLTGQRPEDIHTDGLSAVSVLGSRPLVVEWHSTGEVGVLGGREPRVPGHRQSAELSGPRAVRKGRWPRGWGGPGRPHRTRVDTGALRGQGWGLR